MKNNYLFSLLILFLPSLAIAQDEGEVVKRERIDKNKSIFLSIGPSITNLNRNDADYDAGFNLELGFQKRVNRVVSIGASISHINFPYTPTFKSEPVDEIFIDEWPDYNFFWNEDVNGDPTNEGGRLVEINGGDLSVTTLAFNFKFNFIPIKDNTVFSVYGFAKPFVAQSVREAVSGTGYGYDYNINTDSWTIDNQFIETWDESDFPVLAKKSKIAGGMFLGFGAEFFPAKQFSFFVQISAGYTTPVNIVNFSEYDTTLDTYLENPDFPMVDQQFLSTNASFGLSFNF